MTVLAVLLGIMCGVRLAGGAKVGHDREDRRADRQDRALRGWRRVVHGGRRLGHIRRLWGLLGNLLKQVKARGERF